MLKRILSRVSMGLVFAASLGACEKEGTLTSMSDDELRKRIHDCDYQVKASSPLGAQACSNYHRECARRLELGRFVCQ